MSSYINAELRRLVASRAYCVCEYCLIHEGDTYLGCHIDHIISEKHGGLTEPENLCYACAFCNRSKGTDIGSIVDNQVFTRLYNPRSDYWSDHFVLNGSMIEGKTDIGEATITVLKINHAERLLEREDLIRIGRYLSIEASKLVEDHR